jgi:hypothetical protein
MLSLVFTPPSCPSFTKFIAIQSLAYTRFCPFPIVSANTDSPTSQSPVETLSRLDACKLRPINGSVYSSCRYTIGHHFLKRVPFRAHTVSRLSTATTRREIIYHQSHPPHNPPLHPPEPSNDYHFISEHSVPNLDVHHRQYFQVLQAEV